MFHRSIIDKLLDWSANPDRRPLILRGARQVGKTTAVNMFAESFESYIYLNLEKPEHRVLFDGDLPFTDTLARIFIQSVKKGFRTIL